MDAQSEAMWQELDEIERDEADRHEREMADSDAFSEHLEILAGHLALTPQTRT